MSGSARTNLESQRELVAWYAQHGFDDDPVKSHDVNGSHFRTEHPPPPVTSHSIKAAKADDRSPLIEKVSWYVKIRKLFSCCCK
jgi:hypothetical protein